MRVLQLVQRPQRRGAEVFAYDLNRHFESLGIGVKTVYLYDVNGEASLPLHGEDVCLHGSEHHLFERVPKIEPHLLRKVTTEIKSFEPDIVQVNGSRTVKYGAACKFLARSGRCWKLIYRNIGIPSDWHRWWGTIMAYRALVIPQMDGVVGVSRFSLDNAKQLYGFNVPSEIILNGISPDRMATNSERESFRAEKGVHGDEVVLLFVGYLDDVKRPDLFVRAIARASEGASEIIGWVVGDGPMLSAVRGLASDLGIGDRVEFFGMQRDVASYMQAADVFISTSKTEGVPATILEAGYMGLPAIATKVGGVPECILDGETGILVESDSDEDISDAIVSLVRDPVLRSEMGARARSWVQDHLTIEKIAQSYLAFYSRVLEAEPAMSPQV